MCAAVDATASRSLIVLMFIIAIFIGDVWLWKVTLPISVLLLPALFVVYPPWNLLLKLRGVPPAAILLAVLPAIACVQVATGLSLAPKSDLAIWMPTLFAGAVIIAVREASTSDIGTAIISGGLVTGALMVATAIALPSGTYLIPEQDASGVERQFEERRISEKAKELQSLMQEMEAAKMLSATGQIGTEERLSNIREPIAVIQSETAPQDRGAFAPEMSEATASYYDFKNRFRNLLGSSNYIAAFLCFAAIVGMFTRQQLAAVALFALTLLTLSRFGIAFSALSVLAYIAMRNGYSLKSVAIYMSVLVLFGIAFVISFQYDLTWFPGIESLNTRIAYWYSGWEAFAANPILGAARSFVMEQQDVSITWNPHNWLLYIATYYGVIGLAAYIAYVVLGLRAIYRAGQSSDLWAGVFIGLVTLLLWGLVEIIVLSPAYEILFATLFALARWRTRRA